MRGPEVAKERIIQIGQRRHALETEEGGRGLAEGVVYPRAGTKAERKHPSTVIDAPVRKAQGWATQNVVKR